MPLSSITNSPDDRARGRAGDSLDRRERLIPFPGRGIGEPETPAERAASRRRGLRDANQRGSAPRRARRRRHNTPWLQRNALSVACASILVAFLGLGFGLLQIVNRGESAPTAAGNATPIEQAALGTSQAFGPLLTTTAAAVSQPAEAPRQIQASARALDANYTVASGDTLHQIAAKFNTTADRIQALNNLADPRALRIGTKLVIPPPF